MLPHFFQIHLQGVHCIYIGITYLLVYLVQFSELYILWNDNIQSSKEKKNEASTLVFDSDWTSVSVPQTSEFTRIRRQFHALSANRYTAGINS